MKEKLSVLFVGESYIGSQTEMKGLDHFSEINYFVPADDMIQIFENRGISVTHIPCHMVSRMFPRTLAELQQYDVVLLSDIGANTFLLLPEVVSQGIRSVNLLKLIKEYVLCGGGLCMIGGYMTYQGMEAKGKWKDSPVEQVLPVTLQSGDDRVEAPEGIDLIAEDIMHPVLRGLPKQWPYILGYNRVQAKEDTCVLIRNGADPILVVGEYGKGRSMAYTTDCTPHWAPKAMLDWPYYSIFWENAIRYLSHKA